jgi:hypothetical protein
MVRHGHQDREVGRVVHTGDDMEITETALREQSKQLTDLFYSENPFNLRAL